MSELAKRKSGRASAFHIRGGEHASRQRNRPNRKARAPVTGAKIGVNVDLHLSREHTSNIVLVYVKRERWDIAVIRAYVNSDPIWFLGPFCVSILCLLLPNVFHRIYEQPTAGIASFQFISMDCIRKG